MTKKSLNFLFIGLTVIIIIGVLIINGILFRLGETQGSVCLPDQGCSGISRTAVIQENGYFYPQVIYTFWDYDPIYDVFLFSPLLLVFSLVVWLELSREKENKLITKLFASVGLFLISLSITILIGGISDFAFSKLGLSISYYRNLRFEPSFVFWLITIVILSGTGYYLLTLAENERIKDNAKRSVYSIALHPIGTFLVICGLIFILFPTHIIFLNIYWNHSIFTFLSDHYIIIIFGLVLLALGYTFLLKSKELASNLEIVKKTYYTPLTLISVILMCVTFSSTIYTIYSFFWYLFDRSLESKSVSKYDYDYAPEYGYVLLDYNNIDIYYSYFTFPVLLVLIFNVLTYRVFKKLSDLEYELKISRYSKNIFYIFFVVSLLFVILLFIFGFFFFITIPSDDFAKFVSAVSSASIVLGIYLFLVWSIYGKIYKYEYEPVNNDLYSSPWSFIIYQKDEYGEKLMNNEIILIKKELSELKKEIGELKKKMTKLEKLKTRKS
ncbi:MAG: hypothetical protein N3E37_03830 [Candidatus Micrarchaeota archaeon]|nr:hypothetical protein [Candidatus Micrarchaeota archaeon]